MTRDEMMTRKRELGLTFERMAELTGIPEGTIQNYLYGYTDNPRYDVIAKLEGLLEDRPAFALRDISAELPAYYGKQQGEYTVDDYEAFPEDQRCELIDGVVYDMGSPTPLHQALVLQIVLQLYQCIEAHNKACKVFVSPVDVKLGKDNKTVVQPDVLVICDKEKISWKDKIYGAPDLAVEIISPWSENKDKRIKLAKYADSGVREYWIVDPFKKVVLVYVFDVPELVPTIYSFSKAIPVAISDGECTVDLSSFA